MTKENKKKINTVNCFFIRIILLTQTYSQNSELQKLGLFFVLYLYEPMKKFSISLRLSDTSFLMQEEVKAVRFLLLLFIFFSSILLHAQNRIEEKKIKS